MKIFFPLGLSIALSLPLMSASGPCPIKQQNAASFTYAQKQGVSVQTVVIENYSPGHWTTMVENNVGSDTVRVSEKGQNTHTYRVSAKQISTSSDCEITGVEIVLDE